MLKAINIENIAVIEKCNIDFNEGFNCLTGETGAGKSIVIDSINAVTGQRTSKELVRTGCDKAFVSAVFEDISNDVITALSEYGISADDESVILSRSITADGRNTCKINGVTVNVSVLREIGNTLVNIHGQHDNQALLNPNTHCGFIDAFGKYGDILNDYRKCYDQLRAVRKKIKGLAVDENEKLRRIDLLKYQINEIEAANITVGELDSLIERRELVRNSEKLRMSLSMCISLLSGDDNMPGAETTVAQSLQEFSSIAKLLQGREKLLERFDFAASEIADITAEIRDINDSFDFDPNELENLEQRIDLIKSLNKKYGGDEAAVLLYLDKAKKELASITSSDELLEELEKQSESLEDELVENGEKLTNARRKSALEFSDKICDVLRYLEMPNVVFSVSLETKIYSADGCDKVEFLISANKGQEPKPLSKIASGGELSRTMLAIKSVMADFDSCDTLIFDEIDSGISGRAADKVGRQLKQLSKMRQVLCVTHLAQIAAAADGHYLIQKSTADNSTYTEVTPLEGDLRVKEIARIMSGTAMTENLYNSAKELIENHKTL